MMRVIGMSSLASTGLAAVDPIWVALPAYGEPQELSAMETADKVRVELLRRDPKIRILFLWRLLEGPRAPDQKAWFTEFWKQLGVIPSLVYMDDERGIDRQPSHWDTWMVPYRDVFGTLPPHLNYDEFRTNEPVPDINGHPFPQLRPTVGDINSPVCYNWGVGNLFFANIPLDDPDRMKKGRWKQLIYSVNLIRACIKAQDTRPWVPPSWWCGDAYPKETLTPDLRRMARWWWDQLLIHGTMNGVREWIYWTPDNAHDEHARSMFRLCSEITGAKLSLPTLSLDEKQIVTGDFRTTYDEFEDVTFRSVMTRTPSRAPIP